MRATSVVNGSTPIDDDWLPAETARATTRTTMTWIALAVVVSVLLRLRMAFTPLNADEGGYLAIARAWAHGRSLYRDVWVDRPQGLLAVFRMWDWISMGHTWSVHVLTMVFGAVLVVSSAVVAWTLYGQRAARATALVCAVVSSAPIVEGYVANGELLSGAVATAGLAVALVGFDRRHERRWMFAAGLLAGVAISIKQSGFDALLAVMVWLAVTAFVDRGRRRAALRAGGWLLAGCLVPIVGLVVDAALTGWQNWWFAVGGYRSTTLSLFNHPSWSTLRRTARYGIAVLGPALLVGVVGVVRRRTSRSARWPRADLLVLTWLGAASFAFLLGGGYWRHYWLLLAAPISTLAGAAIGAAPRWRAAVVGLAVAPALLTSIWVFSGNPHSITARAASDTRAEVDQQVADWFDAHRRPGDTLYVMCSSPAVYADIGQDPPVPYLWLPEAVIGPHAMQRLAEYLATTPPTYIAEFSNPDTCDPSGHVKSFLGQRYHDNGSVAGITILSRT